MEDSDVSEYGSRTKKARLDLKSGFPSASSTTSNTLALALVPKSSVSTELTSNSRKRNVRFHALDAYKRHKMLINYYSLTHPGTVSRTLSRDSSRDCNDYQVLLDNHRFIWDDDGDDNDSKVNDDDGKYSGLTWGQRVAKKYYDKLFKEYCIVDLSRYREKKFGMRWRTEPEVIDGKGQFICGAKRCPVGGEGSLTSWEVLFSYLEANQKKQALVKLRLCSGCSTKLNYHHQHKKAKRAERKARKLRKLRRKIKNSNDGDVTNENEKNVSSIDDPETAIKVKEEEDSDVEETEITGTDYDNLIDEIWRRPVKLEPDEQENDLEDEVDDYLNQMLL